MLSLRGCLLMLLLVGCHARGGAGPAEPSPPDATAEDGAAPSLITAVEGVLEQYRQAYAVRSVEALAGLYAQSLDLELVTQGRRLRGWSRVEARLEELFRDAQTVRLIMNDVAIVAVGGGGALVSADVERSVGDGSTTVTERGVLTLVLREELTGWVIVAEHFSYPVGG